MEEIVLMLFEKNADLNDCGETLAATGRTRDPRKTIKHQVMDQIGHGI